MTDVEVSLPIEWRAVVGFEGLYEVSNHGEVRSCTRTETYFDKRLGNVVRSRRPTIIARQLGLNGYYAVHLSRNGTAYRRSIHSLVAHAFMGPAAIGEEVRHLDGCRTNNHSANLAYGTRLDNAADKHRHGTTCRGEKSPSCKLPDAQALEMLRDRAAGASYSQLVKKYSMSQSQVANICRGRRRIQQEPRHAD